MKEKQRSSRCFPSFPHFVQKKWKTPEKREKRLVKTLEKVFTVVEILLRNDGRHVCSFAVWICSFLVLFFTDPSSDLFQSFGKN